MGTPVDITSTAQFDSLVGSNTYVVVDFKAEWCGPCKMIAPVFAQLAAAETKRGKLAFAKVDVDGQPSVAQRYGVSAMPTFLILKGSTVVDTIRGANTSALRSAVLRAAADAGRGPAKSSQAFQQGGRTLGSVSSSTSSSNPLASFRLAPSSAGGASLLDSIIRFFALYVTSFFSLHAETAARNSPFAQAKRD